MSLSKSYYRTSLLMTITEMGFPDSTEYEVMMLYGRIRNYSQPEKEEVAKRAIPLVKKCKTEEEIIAAVNKAIDHIVNK